MVHKKLNNEKYGNQKVACTFQYAKIELTDNVV